MPRKAFRHLNGAGLAEPLLVECGRERMNAGSLSVIATVRIMAPNTSQRGGSSSLADEGQPSRPPPTSPPSTRIASGQSIAISLFGGAWARKASVSATIPA